MYRNISSWLAFSLVASLFTPLRHGLRAQEKQDSLAANAQASGQESGVFFSVPAATSILPKASIGSGTITKTPVANLTNAMYGQLQGLVVRQGSGEPGYDNASLAIRGRGTYDVSGPIYYVDGFQVTQAYFSYLSPEEIDQITVLKDPVSLSTFGMRGANGVIWVVTRRGQARQQQVKFNYVTGWQQPIVLNKPLRSQEYAS
jgi:TonB-dependent SusC/RagA subfamily outer membrane receptor